MSENQPSAVDLRRILEQHKTIAVVGLSANPARPSHGVARYLLDAGYHVIPVNPNETEVLGLRSYPSLRDIPEPVGIVDIFRAADAVPPIVADAIAIGSKVVWMQLGVINQAAASAARAAGLEVVMDACIKIDHARLLGKPHRS